MQNVSNVKNKITVSSLLLLPFRNTQLIHQNAMRSKENRKPTGSSMDKVVKNEVDPTPNTADRSSYQPSISSIKRKSITPSPDAMSIKPRSVYGQEGQDKPTFFDQGRQSLHQYSFKPSAQDSGARPGAYGLVPPLADNASGVPAPHRDQAGHGIFCIPPPSQPQAQSSQSAFGGA
jgi:hypothetical protein